MKHLQTCMLALALAAASAVSAQEAKKKGAMPAMDAEQKAMMEAWQKAGQPGEAHKQLETMAGKWTTKQTVWMDPTAEPAVETGTATNTMIMGGRHLRQDYQGRWMGQPFTGLGFTGYDNVTGKYYSTWADSMATGLFVAHGDYDAASRTYTFRGEMADPAAGGAKIPMRNVVRIVDDDHHVFEMFETRDGKERRSMQIDYARAK